MITKQGKAKKPRLNVWKNEHCKKYDVKKLGFGSADSWLDSFRVRMSLDEAVEILGDDDPLTILGLLASPTIDEIKKAYRKAAMKWHPDMNKGNEAEATKQFNRVTAAYVKLGGK